jgi:putative oxidoreductase
MGSTKKILFFIARFCISAIFLIAAFSHIADFDGMENALTNALYSISEHSSGQIWVQRAVEEVMPFVAVLSVLAVALLVIGGGFVLLGIKYRFGASLLILFLLPTTLIMHHFYFLDGFDKELQATMFWKNLAILGGLIVLAIYPTDGVQSADVEG